MNDILQFSGSTAIIVILGWWFVHYLTSRRDRQNKRREISIQHLIKAYNILTNEISNRPDSENRRKNLELIISEVQLFGSVGQAAIAKQLAYDISANIDHEFDPLINSLRTDLRKQLGLNSIKGNVTWLRYAQKNKNEMIMEVVCDTNTWYDIGSGAISKKSFSEIRLYSSYINLFEMAKTPMLLKDWMVVKRAVEALHKNSYRVIEDNPIEYIIKKQFPNYESKDQAYKEILAGFEVIMKRPDNLPLSDDEQTKMKSAIDRWKSDGEKTVAKVNSLLPEIREKIKSEIGKDKHRKINTNPIVASVINMFVEQQTKGEIKLNMETYPWQEIELLVITWANFFRELEVHPSQKMHPNDWQDIFAMAYVRPGMKYATKDGTFARLILSDSNTKDYLITLD